ncbi:MAG: transcriptional regulator, AraC family [Flaviaesturariibacter sp.]|nr:transcriptional regulator, AraC family [Flaviaesturariibacter sp.]
MNQFRGVSAKFFYSTIFTFLQRMELEKIILIVLSGLGVFHGIFIALILWAGKNASNISNRVLSVLMIILSIRIGKSVVLEFSKELSIIYVYLGLCLLLFIGPLFYMYCRALVSKQGSMIKREWLHFLPGALFIFLAIPLQWVGFKNLPVAVTMLLFFIFYSHLLGYLLFTKNRIIGQGEATKQSGEVSEWLNILFYGLISIWLVYVLNLFEDLVPYIIGPIVYSLTVYIVTYLAFTKKYLQSINAVKYQAATFSEEETQTLYEALEDLVKTQQLFLDSTISLAVLSRRLRASTQKISFTVNTKAGCNFNEYINRYRVAYAVGLLNKPENKGITIASIGMEAGFNSLSSFNQAFKKVTGKTPSQFRGAFTDVKD